MQRLSPIALVLVVAGGLSSCTGRKGPARQSEAEARSSAERPPRPVEAEMGIVLDAATVARIGLATAAVRPATRGAEVTLTGDLVPDSGSIVTIRAPITGRLMTLDSVPWPVLGESLPARQVLGQVSDAKALVAPRGGTVTRVSALPGEIVNAGERLLEITDFSHPLARVVWRADAPPAPPASVWISPLNESETRVRASLIGPAPEVDPLSRTPVYFYRVEHAWPAARPGAPLEARFADARVSAQGLLVPADAVVQWEGLAWVYVARGHGRYVRTAIATDHPVADGYLVLSGLSAGDSVVVRGAQQLLSEEFRARATTEESDEQ